MPQLRPQERATDRSAFDRLGEWRTFYVEDALPDLREYALEVRPCVDQEIEHLRQTARLRHRRGTTPVAKAGWTRSLADTRLPDRGVGDAYPDGPAAGAGFWEPAGR